MIDISEIKFDEKGLVPAIVVDTNTGQVLTLAYMNEESLRISMEKSSPAFGADPVRSCGLRGKQAAITSTLFPSQPTVTGMPW